METSAYRLLRVALLIAVGMTAHRAEAAEPASSVGESTPETLPYERAKAVPGGYHVETRLTGPILLTCGGLAFAASAILAIEGFTAHDDNDGVARAVGGAGIAGMAVSAPFVIWGATLLPIHVLRRNEAASLTVRFAPRLARDDAGVRIVGTF